MVSARVALVALTAGCAVAVTACSGGGSAKVSTPSDSAAPVAAVRWWSNGNVKAGSTIDPAKPTVAAAVLAPSQKTYCAILKQTVKANKSILPDVTADDPSLLASTEAFVADLQALAPAAVSSAWKVLGPAVVALVQSHGALPNAAAAKAMSAAATTIGADAKANCGVDLAGAKG